MNRIDRVHPHLPLRRRAPQEPDDLDDAKVSYIREVAAEYPRFTPEEVYAEIRYGRHRDDITTPMVRYVFAQR